MDDALGIVRELRRLVGRLRELLETDIERGDRLFDEARARLIAGHTEQLVALNRSPFTAEPGEH